jgi:hypothetical protein
VEVIVAENLPTALAYAAGPDVEPHVAAIALREKDGFLEDRHAEKPTARFGVVYTPGTMSAMVVHARWIRDCQGSNIVQASRSRDSCRSALLEAHCRAHEAS